MPTSCQSGFRKIARGPVTESIDDSRFLDRLPAWRATFLFQARRSRMSEFSSEPASEIDTVVRPAAHDDLPALELLIARFVEANRLLPRTQNELQDLVPFGFVAYKGEQLVGFAALEIYSAKLAEIRSLAVIPELQGKGLGRRLVQEWVDLAHRRNILEVMAITSADDFFRACGFDFTLPGEKKALFMQTRDRA